MRKGLEGGGEIEVAGWGVAVSVGGIVSRTT